MKSNMVNIDDRLIAKSMKKVFMEEIEEIEYELKNLYNKYDINNSNELETKIKQNTCDDNIKKDLERIKELEDELNKLNTYLRDVNIKAI